MKISNHTILVPREDFTAEDGSLRIRSHRHRHEDVVKVSNDNVLKIGVYLRSPGFARVLEAGLAALTVEQTAQ